MLSLLYATCLKLLVFFFLVSDCSGETLAQRPRLGHNVTTLLGLLGCEDAGTEIPRSVWSYLLKEIVSHSSEPGCIKTRALSFRTTGDTSYRYWKYVDMPSRPDWYNESSNVSGFTSAFETNSAFACVQGVIFACLNEHMFHRGMQVLQFLFGGEKGK